jgi:membrane associated rhomboid family serine protease
MSKRSPLSYIPGLSTNAVMQLIIVCGVSYVSLQIVRVLFLVLAWGEPLFQEKALSILALTGSQHFFSRPWTLLTYGWFHMGFWELFTNMLWLYCFGSLVQMLVGYKQVIPIFLYSLLIGGTFYLLGQLIPGPAFIRRPSYLLGVLPAVSGLAIAAITIAPKYRYFLTDRLSVPLLIVVLIFAVLMLMNVVAYPSMAFLFIGGGLTGFGYIRFLQNGYRPGEWMYAVSGKLESLVTPNEHAAWQKNSLKRSKVLSKLEETQKGYTQKRIDDILDKINQKGYNSLTNAEKELLMRASKEKN